LQIGKKFSDDANDNRLAFRVDWNGVIYLNDSQFIINNDTNETDGEGNKVTGGTFTWTNVQATKTSDGVGGKIIADTSITSRGSITADGWIRAKGGLYGGTINIKKSDGTEILIVDGSGNISGTSLNVNGAI
jgi:hypothetical protein